MEAHSSRRNGDYAIGCSGARLSFGQTRAAARDVISRAAALFIAGAPRGIRTLDLEIRSLLLYPAELWAHAC